MRHRFLQLPVLAIFLTIAVASAADKKPNFVIIMADDLGYGDIGCFGSGSIPTPHLDALAASGMKFSDYHSNGAVCSPTRAALMTGRYQQRSGISGVVTAAKHRDTGLAVEETTFADLLSENGYATAIFGKWHLGYDPSFNPSKNGFGEFRGYVSGNVDFVSHIDQAGYEDWWHQAKLVPEEGYTTHLITKHGVRFIGENKDLPFCLYLPHEAPHYPYQGPNDPAIREKGSVKNTQGERTDIANAYREMVEEMDKGVGEIVAALKEHGLTENTLVVFCSDNGATNHGSNGPLRGFKGQIWEGGHRVPAIASWPGTITPGATTDVTALSMDWFPTMLDAAGVAIPAELPLDGVSLLPVLTQKGQVSDRTLFWSVSGGMAVRQGQWKLVLEKGGAKKGKKPATEDSVGLYDLSSDLSEKASVENPGVITELRAALDAWLASWADVEQRS
jgi:arylsulfatase A